MNWTCSTELEIARAFDSLEDGDAVTINPGLYPFAPNELMLDGRSHVTVNGHGATLQIADHGTGLTIRNCHDCQINGMTIQGKGYITDPLPIYFALFEFVGVNEWLTLNDCTVRDSGNHGFAHLNGPRASDHITFNRCRAIRCGHLNHPTMKLDGAGFALGGSWNTWNDCHTEGCYRGWELESGIFPELHPTRHVTLNRCSGYRNLHQNVTVMRLDGRADLASDITIKDCELEGWGDEPGCPIVSANVGVYWGGGSDSRITGCTFSRMHDGIGVQVDPEFADTYGLEISGNRFHDLYRPAVFLGSQNPPPEKRKMRDVTLKDNWVRRITDSHGMWLRKGAATVDQGPNTIAEIGKGCDLVHWEDAK